MHSDAVEFCRNVVALIDCPDDDIHATVPEFACNTPHMFLDPTDTREE